MRIAFAGTPAFARVALERLHDAGFDVAAVLSQPDRAAGRGLKTLPSPVKAFALAQGLDVLQPRGLRLEGKWAGDAAATEARLRALAPEAIVVAAYGLILPPWLLALPASGCLNIHASLLPRWRGAAPVQRAIEAGDVETGVTLMQMDAGLDTGAMLLARSTPITGDDTAATLTDRLADIGADLCVEGLQAIASGRAPVPRLQPDRGATYATKITKSEAAIDWREPAAVIERRLRAFDPFPGARSVLDGEVLTLWRARVEALPRGEPGTVVAVAAGAVVVACGEGGIAVTELQRPGGRRLPVAAFLAGRPVAVGARFDLAAI